MEHDSMFTRMELQGAVGEWMEQCNVDRATAIYELVKIAALMQQALSTNVNWRLDRLEGLAGLLLGETSRPTGLPTAAEWHAIALEEIAEAQWDDPPSGDGLEMLD